MTDLTTHGANWKDYARIAFLLVAAFAVAPISEATPPRPSVLVLTHAWVDRPGERETVLVWQPPRLGMRIGRRVDLRPSVRVRSGTETGESFGIGVSLVLVGGRRAP